ncbi:MAG: hypothetical protein ABSD74_20090 [Rhizomicrobium sp.]|jgi:hypothetical protein
MEKIVILVVAILALVFQTEVARAQTPTPAYGFNCVVITCTDTSNGLRNYSGSTVHTYVSAAGFRTQGDGGGDCYQKSNYRGDPHEFGAYGDGAVMGGMHDDTTSIEDWLGAYGNASSLGLSLQPANFGPWIASIPGTYLVDTPLFCPPNATIRGDENLDNNGNTNGPNPRVNFQASAAFSGLSYPFVGAVPGSFSGYGSQAVFSANSYCRLSSIGVTGNDISLETAPNTFMSPTNDMSYAAGSGMFTVEGGNAVYVVDSNGSVVSKDGTVVTSSTCGGASACDVYVSQNVSTGTAPYTAFFFGPDAVDAVANNVTIDSFSLLQNGRYDLFCGTGATGLRVQDTHMQTAMQHGIYIPGPCSNVRLIGNNVSQAGKNTVADAQLVGGDGIFFGAAEGSIEGGIVQDPAGVGIHLSGASQMSITGIDIQGSGKQGAGGAASAGIDIDWGDTITICNNHMEGNGGDDVDSAQVYFNNAHTHVTNNVNLCGNVYAVQTPSKKTANVDVAPLYVYDAAGPSDPGVPTTNAPTLTNIHIYETAAQPAVSVFSPNAQPLLLSALVPQFTLAQINGLTLSDNLVVHHDINIAAGSAADSTNSTTITLPPSSTPGFPACTIDLTASGAGGLDTGSVQPNKTYFIFVIASAAGGPTSGAPTPSCMASTSLTPTFQGTGNPFAGSGYLTLASGGTDGTTNTVYNVSPLNGVAVGNEVTGTYTSPPTTITAFTANTPASATASWSSMSPTLLSVTPVSGTVQYGMAVADATTNCIPNGDFVANINLSLHQITLGNATMSPNTTCAGSGNTVVFSGARQVVLNNTPSTAGLASLMTISTAYWRLIGVLYTDSSSNVVQFTQSGDTIYLNSPVHDIHQTNVGTTATAYPLASVPLGVSVEALGRCAGGGNLVILYPGTMPLPPAAIPNSFSTAPGYAVTSTAPDSAFNFRLYTDTSRDIIAQASAGTTTLDCMTDGWVFHR